MYIRDISMRRSGKPTSARSEFLPKKRSNGSIVLGFLWLAADLPGRFAGSGRQWTCLEGGAYWFALIVLALCGRGEHHGRAWARP